MDEERVSGVGRISLRPVLPNLYPLLYGWAVDPVGAFRWRFHGATPSPEQFNQALWSDVLCQFLVVNHRDVVQGLVVCYGADSENGHAYLAVQGNPQLPTGRGAMVGFLQLVDHVFSHFDFGKLYAEVPEYNLDQFANAVRRHMVVEGVLKGHLYYAGRRWDQVIVALYRDHWDEVRPRFAPLLRGVEGGGR